MEQVPVYVSVVFMVTAFATVGIFLYGVKSARPASWVSNLVLFAVPFWMIFQFILARTGFFASTAVVPPRLLVFAVGPALLFIAFLFVAARQTFISSLPLTVLTIIHIIRIPVELTLAWLADAGAVPELVTFHGTNFDILSGITSPLAFYFATRKDPTARIVLIVWNLAALALVFNVVITAIFCLPTPFQQFAFDQPNIAVLHAPFIWLPAVVVPIVWFCHFASLYKLLALNRIKQ
jgi:hypothetical protein